MGIKNDIAKLKADDVYSLILFVLYQMREAESLSTLSELIYVIDRKSFLQLCDYLFVDLCPDDYHDCLLV